jgi:hypothetical protein
MTPRGLHKRLPFPGSAATYQWTSTAKVSCREKEKATWTSQFLDRAETCGSGFYQPSIALTFRARASNV